MDILKYLSHLFYPHLCLGCGNDSVQNDQLICFSCHGELPYTHFAKHRENKTETIFHGRVKIEYAMSLLYFSKNMLVQNLMHGLKYNDQQELGVYLGSLIGRSIIQEHCFRDIDVIIPLPLSDRKKRMRGYNQSEVLCDGISNVVNKPVVTKNILRAIDTETQTKKHRRERWKNVAGIFHVADPASLQGKHILLVDDVITTGATLEACAMTIHETINAKISIATLAIATK